MSGSRTLLWMLAFVLLFWPDAHYLALAPMALLALGEDKSRGGRE